MDTDSKSNNDQGSRSPVSRQQLGRALATLTLGGLALWIPLVAGPAALWLLGLLAATAGIIQIRQGFDQPEGALRQSGFYSGGISMGIGALLFLSPKLAASALVLFLAGSFVLDGCARLVAAWRGRSEHTWMVLTVYGVGNLLIGMMTALQWPLSGAQAIGIYLGLRLFSAGWAMLAAPAAAHVEILPEETTHPDARLRLPPDPELAKLVATVSAEEQSRRIIDRYWQTTFLFTFLAIHVGRMDADWTLVGLVSPLVAVVGDVIYALIMALGIVTPLHLAWRCCTRPLERRAWVGLLPRLNQGGRLQPTWQLIRLWLLTRLRFSMRVRHAYISPTAALRRGLQIGLPLTAILVAVNPIWGVSWFFNTETWAAGVWEKWVEYRVDPWRQAMVESVCEQAKPNTDLITVTPAGVAGAVDFSFLVIGDPGEGDASQHSLKDQYLRLGARPDTKFLVVSSDVIYPDGAMKDYEFNFYLPFKGFEKPIYAIPGNHDWYDCLEGFNASFLTPDAARAAMRARVAADRRLTSTTERGIDRLIAEADRLRREYGVAVGAQGAPYFEIQSPRFALIAVDTGVLRTVDADQFHWLETALNRARGKIRMVILGHPLYVAGHYEGLRQASFTKIHELLRQHEVELVMAGDTHNFQYYREPYESRGKPQAMHHFVNGGGGAYLSIGTALSWPATPPVPDCAYYPRTDDLIAKLDSQTPGWKLPLWWWVKRLGAWPSSPEAIAGAFDFNRAPFFQSFVEVKVEGSANRVRIIPYGVKGPLRWQDLQCFGAVVPVGQSERDIAEFVFSLAEPAS